MSSRSAGGGAPAIRRGEEGSRPGVAPSALIGRRCRLAADVEVGEESTLGPGVRVGSGARIGPRVSIGEGVVVAAGARIGLDGDAVGAGRLTTDVGAEAVVGPGVVVSRGVSVGAGSWVGGGVHLVADLPALALVDAVPGDVPARLDRPAARLLGSGRLAREVGGFGVSGASQVDLRVWKDARGALSVLELDGVLPFSPRRMFTVSRVPRGEVRGLHAHRSISQLLVCTRGSVQALVDDGSTRVTLRLGPEEPGILMGPMVWGGQMAFSPDAVLVALASAPYDRSDYIQDYGEFLRLVRGSFG